MKAAVSSTFLTLASAKAALRPNIIFIMADDLGWGELETYPSTSQYERIATPNLNDFSASGIQFTNAYAGYTVCAPSRSTLMTGFHSGHFKARGLGTEIAPDWDGMTLPKLLQSAGYATAAVGKVAPFTSPITSQGFDYFIGQSDQALCHNMYPWSIDQGNSTGNVLLPLNHNIPATDVKKQRNYTMSNPALVNYTVDITHQHSMQWVANEDGKMRDPSKPFFLYEAFTVPHAGGWDHAPGNAEGGAPVPSDGQYAKEHWPTVEKDHAAVITYLDNCVGELMTLLEQKQLRKSTIVFFASDNGAHLEGGHNYHFFNSTGGLLGHKRSLFEGGVRSPTLVSWPDTIAPRQSDYAWALWDVLPTMAELAGVAPPANLDGISILPTLMNQTQPDKEYLFWTWRGTGCEDRSCEPRNLPTVTTVQNAKGLVEYRDIKTGDVVNAGNPPSQSGYAIRAGEWKGVVAHCSSANMQPSVTDKMMIYHLPTDPFEANNVNRTSVGLAKKKELLAIAAKHNVTCNCYQC